MPNNEIKYVATIKSCLTYLHRTCATAAFSHANISANKHFFYDPLMSIDLRIAEGFLCTHEIAHDQLI